MKLVLLVSMRAKVEKDWSLSQEVAGILMREEESRKLPDGVVPVGRDSILFDQTIAFGSFVRACAHLGDRMHWPYLVVPADPSSMMAEGTCAEALQAILGRKPAR